MTETTTSSEVIPAGERPAAKAARSTTLLISCVFLVCIVLLSVLTYLPHLGFYSDGWEFLALLKNSPDQSFSGLFKSLMSDHNIRIRPVQVLTWVSLYQLFGTAPLGYHVCLTLLLVCMALFLFVLLLELGQPLLVAVSAPAIYILLPHYSTDRFWIAAIQADISMAFYFLSFYAALRGLRSSWLWIALSVFATLVSVLAYEVAVPLLALTILGVLWKGRFAMRARIAAGSTALAVFACFVFKVSINQRHVMAPGTFREHALWLLQQSLFVNFYQLGLAYPRIVFKAFQLHPGLPVLATTALIAVIVFFFVLWILKHQTAAVVRIAWKHLAAAGGVVFGLGYVVFLFTDQVGFHKTGVNNRVSIAAALGVALTVLGLIGWLSVKLAPRLQIFSIALMVSLFCASSSFLSQVIAGYWIRAYQEEANILRTLDNHHISLKPGGALLIDGVCPYDGPAPVLESWWENSGVAQLVFSETTLVGDAISPRIQVDADALTTYIYEEPKSYPYGDRFAIYNVLLDRVFFIHNANEMNEYLTTYENFSNAYRTCPGRPGEGVAVF